LFDIEDELPLLQARYHDVLDVFGDHGIADIHSGEEECIFLLKETRIRAEFMVKLGRFLETLDTVLPRAEALPYLSDAKQLERIRIRARNRYRDGMLSLGDSGQKIRKLIDEFVLASGINPRIAPISIMDVEGFRQAVATAVSPRAKASEMEEALRHHITNHAPEDPVYYRRLSEQLNALLEKYHNDWEALAAALEHIRCTPMSRQQNDIFISGLSSFIEIDLSRCLVIESLMQSPIVVEVEISGQAAACLTG
jgi:type I restriction enzyme R subunit